MVEGLGMNFKPVDGLGDVGYAPLGAGEVYPGYGGTFLPWGGAGESDELFPVLCLVKSYQ